jgi:hypothetical protein
MKHLKIYETSWYISIFFLANGMLGFLYDIYTESPSGLRLYFLIIMAIASLLGIIYCVKKRKTYYFKYDNNKIEWLFPHMDESKVMDIQNISAVGGVGHIINIKKQNGHKELFSVEHINETAQEKIKKFFQSRVR